PQRREDPGDHRPRLHHAGRQDHDRRHAGGDRHGPDRPPRLPWGELPPPMKILDRYMAKELLGPFLFGFALFITVLVSGEYLFKLTGFIARGAPFLPVVELFGLRVVTVSVLTLPAAMLLATLLAFGRLSGDSELVAIQAGGVPVYRVAYMSVAFGLVVSLVAFVISEFVIPPSAQTSRRLEAMIVAAIKNQVVKEAGAGKYFVVQDFDGQQLA